MKEGGHGARPCGQDQNDDAQLGWMHPEIDELYGSDTWRVHTTRLRHRTCFLDDHLTCRRVRRYQYNDYDATPPNILLLQRLKLTPVLLIAQVCPITWDAGPT